MNRNNRSQILAAVAILLAFVSLLITFSDRADADSAYAPCSEAGRYASSPGAQDCRDLGWKVGPGYSVTPRGVLRYYDLPTCRNEDGSGQARTCGWNVTEGSGRVYLAISRTSGDDRILYLNRCRAGVCSEWVR